jgi:spore coat protein U-like protein
MRKQIGRLMAGATVAVVVAGAAQWGQTAGAATVTANVAVSAAVSANCVVNAGTVTFGTYDPLVLHDTANLDVDGAFTLQCTKGTPATLSLGNGTNFSGGLRRMASGANFLTYDLYTTGGRTTVWNGTNTVAYTATSKAVFSQSIYGRVPGGQDASVGSYTDTVVASVVF